MDLSQIERMLPHRPPFLLVDEIVELEPGVRCVALRTLRGDDFWFAGHFPGNPVMPGVLIVEALAQTATLAAAGAGPGEGRIGLFAGIDKVRFKRVVKPGDTLRLEAEITSVHGAVGKAAVKATVDGGLACRGELMFAVVDADDLAAGEARLGGGT
jgi:3-hydroxyacyl-[acyl-carrier-protein] dehydratase